MPITILKNKTKLAVVLALTVFLISSTSWAATYYVDQTHLSASDSNTGTESKPFKTIQRGADKAIAGDTVYVKNGIYKEQVIVKSSGTASKPITFMAYPGVQPIIDGTGVSLGGNYKGLLQTENNDYIIFDGFHVRNSEGVLIRARDGKGIVIRNNLVHTNKSGVDGIFLVFCTDSYVDSNEAYDCGWNAINITSCSNTKTRHNYIHDHSKHAAINIFPVTTAKQTLFSGNDIIGNTITRVTNPGGKIYTRYQTDNIIANNLIYDNVGTAIRLDKISSEPMIFQSNTRIVNNTIVGNGEWAINITNATHTTIKNNIFDSNKRTIYLNSSANKGHSIDYNIYNGADYANKGPNGFYGNPLFKNKSNNDYSLSAQSPAKDKGEDISHIITKDISQNPRPQGQGFEIGAFELQDVATGLTPPQNVRVASF